VSAHRAQILPFPERQRDGVVWEPWVDERQVARHFDVSSRTVRRWRDQGMPSQKVGGLRRFRLTECERWHEGAAEAR
jgi:phage terminase Nu1 subunit (DNA packaging protein)